MLFISNNLYFRRDDFSTTGYSDAFEKHLERQEQERYKRYVQDVRKNLVTEPIIIEDPTREIMYDRSDANTGGVTLQFSQDPMLSVHVRKNQVRQQLTNRCYESMINKGSEKRYIDGTNASLDIKPDPKYLSIAAWCEKERKNGIEEQIKLKHCQDKRIKEMQKEEQDRYKHHWETVNQIADQIEMNKRVSEANFVSEEMQKHEANRLRQYAHAQIEKERMRKLNQKMSENNQRFDNNK